MTTSVLGSGRLQVTITPGSNAGFAANAVKSIQFQQATLAVFEVPGQQPSPGPFTETYPNATAQTTFVVRRTGAGSVLARFTVTDNCGTWPSFVGGGPSAGW